MMENPDCSLHVKIDGQSDTGPLAGQRQQHLGNDYNGQETSIGGNQHFINYQLVDKWTTQHKDFQRQGKNDDARHRGQQPGCPACQLASAPAQHR